MIYQTYISWYYWWCTRPIFLYISGDVPDLYFFIFLVMYQTYISWYYWWCTRPIFLYISGDVPDLYFFIFLVIYQTFISLYFGWCKWPIFLYISGDVLHLYFLIFLVIHQTCISWFYWLECRASGSRDSTIERGEKTKKKETNNSRYSRIFPDVLKIWIYSDFV